jgi:hypothetical protein
MEKEEENASGFARKVYLFQAIFFLQSRYCKF